MQLSTNQIEGTLHEREAGQVTNNPLRYVPPSMVLMVLKAARTSIASAKKTTRTVQRSSRYTLFRLIDG
jgi:hypothetical protein